LNFRAGGTREEVIQAWAKAREDYRSAEKELSSLESVNAVSLNHHTDEKY